MRGTLRLGPVAALLLLPGAFGCAEVYTPRPSSVITVAGTGSRGYAIYKNGEAMGGEWSVRDAVSGNARAESEADAANAERIGSLVTNFLGAGATAAGAIMIGVDAGNTSNNNQTFPSTLGYAGIGVLAGGIVLEIVSGVLAGNAHTHMFNAVNMYNDDLLHRGVPYGLPGAVPPGYVAPGPGYQPTPVDPRGGSSVVVTPQYAPAN